MATASMIIGILSLFGTMIGCIPLLGALNWLTIPLGVVGAILGGMALSKNQASSKGQAMVGLVLSIVVIVMGTIRLIIGGGLL
jgi:hypothetical protein